MKSLGSSCEVKSRISSTWICKNFVTTLPCIEADEVGNPQNMALLGGHSSIFRPLSQASSEPSEILQNLAFGVFLSPSYSS